MATAKDSGEIYVAKIEQAELTFFIKGTAPLICNRMSQKVLEELLLPKGKKTAADKASTLKHDPLEEYRQSPYTSRDEKNPTRLQLLASMFKKGMMTAALDIPGARSAQIGRLVYVVGDRVNLYGVPELLMAVTRSADMNRTPDVRSRAIIREWAAQVTVRFQVPIIKDTSIANLLVGAGQTSGIGDYRVQKGGSYGTFEVCGPDDKDFARIVKNGGKAAQDAALAKPGFYDDETETLYAWYESEVPKRGMKTKAMTAGA
jgi:hypothetical protein